MQILHLEPHTVAEMKKPHPCGGKQFEILRVGGVCRVRCTTCGRDTEMDRIKLERAVKRILPTDKDAP